VKWYSLSGKLLSPARSAELDGEFAAGLIGRKSPGADKRSKAKRRIINKSRRANRK
jgi:hypothetical protein